MSNWESEKQFADELRQLTAQVKELQNEIRGDALTSKAPRKPALPTEEERRERSIADAEGPRPPHPDEKA